MFGTRPGSTGGFGPPNYELGLPKSTRAHHISHRETLMTYRIVGVCVEYGGK